MFKVYRLDVPGGQLIEEQVLNTAEKAGPRHLCNWVAVCHGTVHQQPLQSGEVWCFEVLTDFTGYSPHHLAENA